MKLGGILFEGSLSPRLAADDPIPPDEKVNGQNISIDALYRSQAPRLFRFFARRTERHEASDLVQESFVRFVHSQNSRVEPLDAPEAYLQQIATNILRNRARTAFQRSVANYSVDDAIAPETDPGEALQARDMLDRLQAAMLRLSPKTREIFMAHRLDGASYAQIAERAGLSVKGVEWHMSKAIAHLHRALGSRR